MNKPNNTRIVFFGTDDFSATALEGLISHGYNVVAVVTKPDAAAGRGRTASEPAVKRVASAHQIRVFQPHQVAEIIPEIDSLKPDAGVVVAYGKILPQSLLNLFPIGLINTHASLLPRYRGASPIEAAILNGDTATGITLMQIDAGMDTGPVYAHSRLELDGTETQTGLYDELAQLGSELLVAKLPDILSGSLKPVAQDDAKSSSVAMIKKTDGDIDWSKAAATIERQIRAFQTWPGSRTYILGTDVIITAAQVATSHSGKAGSPYLAESGELAVVCGEGSLIIERLKPAGKREMTGREFLAGHPLG